MGKRRTFSDGFLAHHELNINSRYVFFDTLPDQKISTYHAAYRQGMKYVHHAEQQLSSKHLKDNEDFAQTMLHYIQLINEIATNERNNEIEFVRKFEAILKKTQLDVLKPDFKQLVDDMYQNFDYPKLINLINEMLGDTTDFLKKQNEIIQNNMELISKNYDNASKQTQQDLAESLNEGNFKKFFGIGMNTLLKPITDENEEIVQKFQTMASSLFARKFNSILYNIVKNQDIIEAIKKSWLEDWNASTIQKTIIGIVTNYLLDVNYDTLLNSSGAAMAQNIANNFTNLREKINSELTSEILQIVTKKITKTIEEVALTSKAGIGQMFLNLTKEEQTSILKKYRPYGLNLTKKQIEKTIREKGIIKAKALITKELGKAIRKAADQLFDYSIEAAKKNSYADKKAYVEFLKKTNSVFFQERELKETLETSLSVTLSGPSFAEFKASYAFKKALADAQTFTPGRSIQLKTDASVNFTYTPLKFTKIDKKDNITKDILDNWMKIFLNKYKEKGQGKTDVAAAAAAFASIMQDTKKSIEDELIKLGANDEEIQQSLQQLNDFVNLSISVKEYNFAIDQLGFTGGSLGPNSEIALDNIYKMYELGGITKIDMDTLYFVLINCGPHSLAHGLKDNLEAYLLGGAAMMMFDDGFATANAFIKQMIQEYGFMPKILHLYVVQGKFIPASIVYTSIYNALLKIYQDIIEKIPDYIDTGNVQNSVNITNNILEENYKWDYTRSPYNYAQNRFNKVSYEAINNIDIRFHFLAGILDLFEQIPTAFDIK